MSFFEVEGKDVVRGKQPKVDEEIPPRTRELYRLYEGGATLEEAGLRFDLSRERVRQLFRDSGLATRSFSQTARLRNDQVSRTHIELVNRVRDTGDLEFVAAEFDMPVQRAKAIVRQHDITLLAPTQRGRDRRDRVPMGFWTKERIVDAVQRWVGLYDRPPTATDWNPALARRNGQTARLQRFEEGLWPHVNTVQTKFGKWNDAIRAAGFEATKVSSYGRPGDDPKRVAAAVDSYREGAPLGKAAREAGISSQTLAKALTDAGLALPGVRIQERIKMFLQDRDWTPARTVTFALPDASIHVYRALNALREDPDFEFLEMAGRGVFVRLRA